MHKNCSDCNLPN